ncbi:MAG: OmpA/MotB family protein [Chitinophagaceae bacterium]
MIKKLIFLFLAGIYGMLQAQISEPRTPYKNSSGFSEHWYNMWSSKKFKKSTLQRDSLYTLVQRLKKDTAQQANSVRDFISKNAAINNQYQILQANYDDLMKTSMDKATQLNNAVNQKNKELLEREKKIVEIVSTLQEREKKVSNLENQLRKQDSFANAINNALKQALLSFASDDLNLEVKNGKVYVSLFDKLLFKSGSATVEKGGIKAVKKLAAVLLANPNIDILVEGHTDNIPIKTSKYADNWDLSAARAINIVRLLQSYNVDPKIVKAAAHAEFAPISSNTTLKGRAKNRRTEIIVTPNLGKLFNIINSGK